MPLYIFDPLIFQALRVTRPGKGGEIQLTDGMQRLVEGGHRVQAMKLQEDDIRLDISTPETYWEALESMLRPSETVGLGRLRRLRQLNVPGSANELLHVRVSQVLRRCFQILPFSGILGPASSELGLRGTGVF